MRAISETWLHQKFFNYILFLTFFVVDIVKIEILPKRYTIILVSLKVNIILRIKIIIFSYYTKVSVIGVSCTTY